MIEDLIKIDQLKLAEKHKNTLEKRLNEMNNHIEDLKNSLILEKPRPTNQVKKMIEISDDRTAAEKAEFLVRKLNNEKKLRESKKLQEMQKRDQEVKFSIDDMKKNRVEKQDRLKYEKHQNIFERLDNHEKNKLNLVSSEFSNAAFIKGLYKGAHYFKPLRMDPSKNKIILPHLPKDLYSFKTPQKMSEKVLIEEENGDNAKKLEKTPKQKVTKTTRKLKAFSKEYLAERIEREEKILIEREKILQEEKKILEARKKQFETKDQRKKIGKELQDIEKALFNYQSLKKYELSPVFANKSQDNMEEEKFLEYKTELKSWNYGHFGKSESPVKKDFQIKGKISKGVQAEDEDAV